MYYQVTFKELRSSICERLHYCFEGNKYTDVTFVCKNNRKIYAHKIVVSPVSPFLKAHFFEDQHTTIIIPDISFAAVDSLMTLLYEGSVKVSANDVEELRNLVKLLGVCLPQSLAEQFLIGSELPDAVSVAAEMPVISQVPSGREYRAQMPGLHHTEISDQFGTVVDLDCETFVSNQVVKTEDTESSVPENASDRVAAESGASCSLEPNEAADATTSTDVTPRAYSLRSSSGITSDVGRRSSRAKSRPPSDVRWSWQCQVCNRTFLSERLMIAHSQTHVGIFPHRCPVCSRGYLHLHNMKEHMLCVHEGGYKKIRLIRCRRCHHLYEHIARHRKYCASFVKMRKNGQIRSRKAAGSGGTSKKTVNRERDAEPNTCHTMSTGAKTRRAAFLAAASKSRSCIVKKPSHSRPHSRKTKLLSRSCKASSSLNVPAVSTDTTDGQTAARNSGKISRDIKSKNVVKVNRLSNVPKRDPGSNDARDKITNGNSDLARGRSTATNVENSHSSVHRQSQVEGDRSNTVNCSLGMADTTVNTMNTTDAGSYKENGVLGTEGSRANLGCRQPQATHPNALPTPTNQPTYSSHTAS